MNDSNSLQYIAYLRREYTYSGLRREDLPDNPLVLFENWLHQVCSVQLPDPTAMTVATVDSNGQPYQRTVLLKHYDEKGMIFYTNLFSRKALHLSNNAAISLHFPWYFLDRQVMILGKAEKLSPLEVLKYFYSRPRDSQIAAWVSKQSRCISSRNILECKFFEFKKKFKQNKIPLPSFWGGFCVKFHTIEFWQGGKHRLHDRFLYTRNGNSWTIDRLSP
ncbi:pyridoxamine 5'-phosphate oxidase [Candidatus Pantoea carbekii]|uniref:Pyridoxine/pyridoxamine 5'-phosphate oxidase n=1 Tax=Candidatus Pantoea carbekii TaxID=1235990 RepID=U3U6M7_9GAMM|nr:pyridoxamine 5'-phosphate oxidase [Candidatus Pantoea carbekii]AKC32089.1 pyridoxamine 5-phosphate oxidase PdxH [Candidatus Pantoea carbekii]BAO00615.1 PdxH protein [Candidatus Pantoea carbekii]